MPLKAWVKNALDQVIQVMHERARPRIRVGRRRRDRPAAAGADAATFWSAPASRRARRRGRSWGSAAPRARRRLSSGSSTRTTTIGGGFRRPKTRSASWASPARKPRPVGVQVASNDAVMSDVGGLDVAQTIAPEPPPLPPEPPPPPPEPPPPPPKLPETPPLVEGAPAATAFSLEDMANGKFPGVAAKPGAPRAMAASDDPTSAAQAYMDGLAAGQTYTPVKSKLDSLGARIIKLADGTYITYRPPGVASEDTAPTTASIDINSPKINAMNGGRNPEIKIPKEVSRK